MRLLSTSLVACVLSGAALAQHDHASAPAAAVASRPAASREWTRQPLLLPGMNRRGERAAAVLRPRGIESASVTVFASEGPAERRRVDYPIGAEGAIIESATPRIGNYHWVIARQESADAVQVASTAWFFGNPGDSPKTMLGEAKHELEIVPDPLPREHANYRESEKWRFLIRMNGVPLVQQPVTLETEFGSRSTFLTDPMGVATVLFPRDFKPADAAQAGQGGHGPRRAKFVLTTEKEAAGRRYLTAFNLTYGQDADRDRSLGWGAAFGLFGMVAATPLLRRRVTGSRTQSNGDSAHA